MLGGLRPWPKWPRPRAGPVTTKLAVTRDG